MPSTALTSVNDGVTVRPPCTASDNVTVKVIPSPSSALASAMVTAALSSLLMVPVPVSVTVTVVPVGASDTARLTVKVSFASTTVSSVVSTVNVFVSPLVPVKVSAVVFSS